jgi:hypothetical protein
MDDAESDERKRSRSELAEEWKPEAEDDVVDNGAPRKRRKKSSSNAMGHLIFDWDAVADGSQATDTSIYKSVSPLEFENLVGWATHVTRPNANSNQHSSPFIDLPSSPLPASVLYAIHEEAEKFIKGDKNRQLYHLFQSFDQSALVALGMSLEEIFTASLMPLAKAHVRMCRRDGEEDNDEGLDRWTLPPEECILEIAKQAKNGETLLPSIAPPLRTSVAGDRPQCSVLNQPSIGEQQIMATKSWAESHDLEVAFLQKNKEIFRAFEPDTDSE